MNLRFVLFLLSFSLIFSGFGQIGSGKKNKNNPFAADKPAKWIMGLKVGINKSKVRVGDRYSVFSPLDAATKDVNQKTYDKKNKWAPQISLMTTFLPIPNLGLSIQPAFFSYRYGYQYENEWSGEANSTSNNYRLDFDHKHTINYLELPLYIKYYIINKDFYVAVQAGGFYGKLLNAKKKIGTIGTDNPGPDEFVAHNETQSFDINDSYIKTYTGLAGGGSIGIKADNFRIGLEINYRKGLNNVINEKARYTNNRLVTAFYDTPDDISFSNWEISLSASLPLDNLVHVAKKSEMPKAKGQKRK